MAKVKVKVIVLFQENLYLWTDFSFTLPLTISSFKVTVANFKKNFIFILVVSVTDYKFTREKFNSKYLGQVHYSGQHCQGQGHSCYVGANFLVFIIV